MWQLVEDLNSRVAEYAHFGDEAAVTSDDAVARAQRVLQLSGQALPNGPAGLERAGLGAVASLFLCRCDATGSLDDQEIMATLRSSAPPIPGGLVDWLLDYAREFLLRRSWRRLAMADPAVLGSDECTWEMDLLERASAELVNAGRLTDADTAAAYCLASQRWLRFLETPPGESEAELLSALAGFEEVYTPEATVVPPLVREYLECLHYPPDAGQDGQLGGDDAWLHSVSPRMGAREAGRSVLLARLAFARTGRSRSELWLCSALAARSLVMRRLADLDEAISRGWRLWDQFHATPGQLRAQAGSILLRALLLRFMMTGESDDIEKAIDVGIIALAGMPLDSWDTWEVIQSLSAAIGKLTERDLAAAHLDQVIRLVMYVAVATKESHLDPAKREDRDKDLYVESVYYLSLLYKQLYDLSGNPEHLDQAVTYGDYASERGKQGGPEWSRYTFEIAKIYFARYQSGGSRIYLDNAITLVRALIWHQGLDRTGRPLHDERRKLGEWLAMRFQELGHDRDRDEAAEQLIGLAEEVGDNARFASRGSLLANAAAAVAATEPTEAQARRAVAWARQALVLSAAGDGDPAHARFTLGRALLRLHHYDTDPAVLDEAIDHMHHALAASGPGPLRVGAAYELSRMLVLRYGADDPATLAALEFAVSVASGRAGHDARLLLAITLLDRARRGTGDAAEQLRGMALLEQVALAPDVDGSHRVEAALGWASEAVARHEFSAAARAYRAAIEALPSPLWWASWIHERRKRIQELDGVARAAAACAVRAGMTEHALESLERGRAMLWNQAMQMRAATERVTAADPRLGEQFSEILDVQQNLTGATNPQTFSEYMAATLVTLQLHNITGVHPKDAPLALATRWQDLVARARRMPGLADIMCPPAAAALHGAVTGGAAVLINMHRIGSHALIVTAGDVEVVELTELVAERVVDVVRQFWQAIHMLDLGVFDPASRRQVNTTITATRRWLWEAIAAPVLDRLGVRDTPSRGQPWPRVWWCPAGVLSMLPLHAAGEDGAGECVIDRVISSYTVTLSALLLARARPGPGARLVLAVGGGEIRGAARLPGVAEELADLEARFPGKVTRLDGSRANVGAVINELRQHSWIHLACHASQGFGDHPPSLHLDDGPLRIERLGWSSASDAELAFLSACSTAETTVDMIDEAHHLAAALQVAGFRHVVGTLWGANDRTGVRVSREFYDRLGQLSPGSADAAPEALHHAVRAVREDGDSAFLWAPFVHYGP